MELASPFATSVQLVVAVVVIVVGAAATLSASTSISILMSVSGVSQVGEKAYFSRPETHYFIQNVTNNASRLVRLFFLTNCVTS